MYPNEETYPTTESEKENLRLRSAESTVICDHFQEGNHHTLDKSQENLITQMTQNYHKMFQAACLPAFCCPLFCFSPKKINKES